MGRGRGKTDSKWDLSKWNLDESQLTPGDRAWFGNKSNEKRPNLWDSLPVDPSRRAGKEESERSNERRSSWGDLKEESRLSVEKVRDNLWLGKKEKKPNPWFSIPVTGGAHDDDSSRRPGHRSSAAPLSPARDDWRQHRRHSPKKERSHRVHERSRSVSRSPIHGYRPARETERGSRRDAVTPCRFFAAGNCRSRKDCRFSHDGDTRKSPDRRPRDDTRVQSHYSDREKSWVSPKWGDANPRRYDTWNSSCSDREKSWGTLMSSDRYAPLSDTWKSRNDKMERTNVPERHISSYSTDDKEVSKTENLNFNSGIADTSNAYEWIHHEAMSPGLNFGTGTSKNVVKEDHGHFIQSSQIPNGHSVHTMENVYEAVKTEPTVIEKSYLKPDDDIALQSADKNTAGIPSTDLSPSLAYFLGGPQPPYYYSVIPTAVSEVKNGGDEEKSTGQGNDEKGGEQKKSKHDKAVRSFKFALLGFVKELLKPAWKEGQVKKDDFKNIVKKVVDKVTGTMTAGNVPQTKEKIDQYLLRSKPKLKKLVEDYVEIFKKGSKEA